MSKERVTVFLDAETKAALDRRVSLEGLPVSLTTARILREALQRLEPGMFGTGGEGRVTTLEKATERFKRENREAAAAGRPFVGQELVEEPADDEPVLVPVE